MFDNVVKLFCGHYVGYNGARDTRAVQAEHCPICDSLQYVADIKSPRYMARCSCGYRRTARYRTTIDARISEHRRLTGHDSALTVDPGWESLACNAPVSPRTVDYPTVPPF